MLEATGVRRLALAVLAASLACLGCGSNKPTTPIRPPGSNSISDGFTFTREDSTTILMGRTHAVCCSLWEPGYINRETVKILYYDNTKARSTWKMFVIPDEMTQDSVFSLPTPAAGQGPVMVFVYDVGTGNEASSVEQGSSGTVTIHSLSCGPPTRIDATIDAFLGSEFAGGGRIRVRGRFTATVYTNPIACDFSM
ncbi:MAG: hypothetical protein E6K76_06615 [Candidatus Eisenbacteria bacterium]|uniref:Uncharacterized protein n=1 Tax=Eiseniibacteriota bacterium TaxID=2212470 RepID=A0A538T5H2_UNCEI|nr:MAG: hypothetical protein E6K76_06615 [Candidatus Eisenbacteria bacterium]